MNGCLLLRLGNGFFGNNFRTKEGDFVATFGVNNTGPSVASKFWVSHSIPDPVIV